MLKSEIESIQNEYELDKILGYYHPEIYSFKMQHSLLINEGIVISDLNYSVSYFLKKTQKIKISKIDFVIAKPLSPYFIKFDNRADHLLVFKDDVVSLTYNYNGDSKVICGDINILDTPLNQLFLSTEGIVKVNITGVYRDKLFQTFTSELSLIFQEYHLKTYISYNLEKVFSNRGSHSRFIGDIIKERLVLIGMHFNEDFNWDIKNPKHSSYRSDHKTKEFLTNNNIPNQKICYSMNCLEIIEFNDSFKTSCSNRDIVKKCESIKSYEQHILKFVKKIIYLWKLSLNN